MLKRLFFLVTLVALFSPGFVFAQQSQANGISSPAAGQTLKGVVEITGSANGGLFQSYDLVYGYDQQEAPTWFPITTNSQPVVSGVLGTWDTTTISDGDYVLRLIIHLTDGTNQKFDISAIHVRNYTFAATNTPAPTGIMEATAIAPGTTSTPFASMSSVTNPASLTPKEYRSALRNGAAVGLAIILILVLHSLLRRWGRK